MFYTITSKQNLVKYLDKRLNLSAHILWKLANEVCNLEATKVSYRKDNDKIFYCGNDGLSGWFSATYWLRKHYTQCACCGEWFIPNVHPKIFGTSVVTIYSQRHGKDYTFECCAICTMEGTTNTKLSEKMRTFDSGMNFQDTFYARTHDR